MPGALAIADDLLHGSGPFAPHAAAQRPWWWLPLASIAIAPLYGLVMGSYSVTSLDRVALCIFAGLKLPLLLLGSAAICLPAFFILNTALGLRGELRAALQAIWAGQAVFALALASLAPLTAVWYASDVGYRAAVLFNGVMFALGTTAGHSRMLRHYRPLIRRNRMHATALAAWLTMYVFVGIQMAWMLRPFVGSPHEPPQFFRSEPFSNAYVALAKLLAGSWMR